MHLIEHKQGSPEWLELRRKGIGASEAPVIMGVSPWTTPYQLWQRKQSGAEQAMNASMRYGKDTEEAERKKFEKMVGITFFPDMTFRHGERHWQIASLDGIDFNQTVIMEIKQANQVDHQSAKEGTIPKKYYPQIQHQLDVVRDKIDTCLYCSSHKGDRVIVEVKRDEGYIAEMIAKETEFYEENMLKGISPVLDMEDTDWAEEAAQYRLVDADIKRLEKQREVHRKALIRLSNGLPCKGSGVVLTTTTPLGLVDYKAIPELSGVDLDKYRKPSVERWTVRTL
jgi:putative phage-type endonuclease